MYRPGVDNSQFRPVPVAPAPPGMMNMGPYGAPMPSPMPPPMPPPQMSPQMPPPIPGRPYAMPQFSFPAPTPTPAPPSAPPPANSSALRVPGGNMLPRPALVSAPLSVLHMPPQAGQAAHFVPPLPPSPPSDNPPPPPPSPPPASPPPPPSEEVPATPLFPPEPAKPNDPEVLKHIEVLVPYVVKNGPRFESITRARQAGDPKFAFLFEDDGGPEAVIAHNYYKWRKQIFALQLQLEAEGKTGKQLEQLKSLGKFQDANGKLVKTEDMPVVPGSPAMSDMDMEDDFASPPQVREPVGQQEDEMTVSTEEDWHSKRNGLSDTSLKEQVVDHQEQVLLRQKQETLLVSSRSPERGLEVASPWGSRLSQQTREKGPARELVEFDPAGDEKFYTSDTSKPNHSSHIVGHFDSRVDKAYVTAGIYPEKNTYKDEDGPQGSGRFRSDLHMQFEKGAVVSNQVNYAPRDKIVHQCEDGLGSPERPLIHLTAIAQENRIGRVSRWGTLPPAQPLQGTLESHDHGKAIPKEDFHDDDTQRREASASPNCTSGFNDAGNMVKLADRSDRNIDDSPRADLDQCGNEEAVSVDEFGRLVRKGGSESDSDREERPRKQRRTGSRSRSSSSRSRSRSRSRSIDSRSWSRSPDDSRWRRQTRRRGRWSRSRSRSPRWRRSFSRTPPRDLRRGGFGRGDRDWRNDREYFGRGRRGGRGSGPILCIHYARGRCFRGSACRFFHPDDEVMAQERGVWMREGQIDRDREGGAQERGIWVREGQTERSEREVGPVQDRGAMRELQGERPFREVAMQERGGWMRGIQAERPNQEAMPHEQSVWMREVQPERHERVAMGHAQAERPVAVSIRNEQTYRHPDTFPEKVADAETFADLRRQHHGNMAAEARDVLQEIDDREDVKMPDTDNIAEGNDKLDMNGEIKEAKRPDLVDKCKWSDSKGMADKVDIIDDSQVVRNYTENLVPQRPDFNAEFEKVRTIDKRGEMDMLVEPSVLVGKERASTGGETVVDNSSATRKLDSAQVVILSEKSEMGENADVHMQKYTDEKQEVIAGEVLAGKVEISSEPEATDKSNSMGPKSVLPIDQDTKIVAERSIVTKSESLSEMERVDLPSMEMMVAAGPKLSPGVVMVERQQVATKVSIEQREEIVHDFEKSTHTEPETTEISQVSVGLSSRQQLEVEAAANKFEAKPDLEQTLPQGQQTQGFPARPSISGPPLLAPPQLSFSQTNIMGPPIPANNTMGPTVPMANSAPPGPFGQVHIGSSQPYATFGPQQTNSLPHSLPPGNIPPYNQSSSFRPPMNSINPNQNLPAGGNFNVQQRQPFGHQIFGQPSGAINSHAGPPPQSYPPGSIQNRPTFFPGPSMHDMPPQAHGPPNQVNYGPPFARPGFPQSTMMPQQSLVPSQLGFPSSQPVTFPGQLPAPQQHVLPGNMANIQVPVQGGFSANSSLPPERPPFQHPLSSDAAHPSVMDSSTPNAYPRTSLVPSAPSVPSGPNPWSLHSSGQPPSAIPAKTGEPSIYSYSLTTIPPLSNLIKVPGVAGLPTGDQYDPLSDSLDPNAAAATKSSTYGPVRSAEDGRDMNVRTSNLENTSQVPAGEKANALSNKLDTVEGETANLNEATADVGVVENVSPPGNWSPGPAEGAESGQDQAQSKDKKSSRGLKLLRSAVAEHVKELLKPTWREGHMSKEAFKTIAKKAVEKVTGNLPSHHIPKSQEKVDQFMAVSRSKISKLVQGYVDKYLKV